MIGSNSSPPELLLTHTLMNNEIPRLLGVLADERDQLLSSWRREVRQLPGAAGLDVPTLNDQVPQLLDTLLEALRAGHQISETNAISTEHGLLRWQVGFDITEVLAEYNILRRCLYDTIELNQISYVGTSRQIIDSVFEDAVAKAVKAFEMMMTIELQHRNDEHLAFILHDLRTPLEAMSLATTLLDRSLSDSRSSGVISALSVMRGNISRLSARVRHVLSAATGFGKSFSPQFGFLNLRSEVERVVRDLEPLATSASTEVSNNIDAQVAVFSEELLLGQIIQNLLSNAIKFTSGGRIEIGAEYTDDREWIQCWVRDSGTGIPPDQITKVFERFETSGVGEEKGVGLGLAIVKEIVELHKGQIRVHSEVGRGSTFTFVLPCKEFR